MKFHYKKFFVQIFESNNPRKPKWGNGPSLPPITSSGDYVSGSESTAGLKKSKLNKKQENGGNASILQ